MSTEVTSQSGQAPVQSNEEPAIETATKTPNIEDLQRRLKETAEEAKRYRQRLAETEKRAQEAEAKKLQESGEYKTLYEKAEAKLAEERENTKKTIGNLALNQLKSAFKAEAVKAGCSRPDALEKILGIDRLSKAMTSDYEVDPVLVKSMIEDAQKENDFLFAKQAPSVRDSNPGHQKPQAEKPVSEMNIKELEAYFRKLA